MSVEVGCVPDERKSRGHCHGTRSLLFPSPFESLPPDTFYSPKVLRVVKHSDTSPSRCLLIHGTFESFTSRCPAEVGYIRTIGVQDVS
jgi:hypothetical protein